MKGYEYCGQQDSNLHGFPTGPKPAASANSAIAAYCEAIDIHLIKRLNDIEKEMTERHLFWSSQNEASGTRTPDNLIKSQVLYHLS